MDPITQLFGSFFGLLLLVAIAVWLCTPLVWTWLAFRFFRDVHRIADDIGRIRETAWYQIDAIRSTPPPREVMQRSVSNSAFGR